MENADKLVSDLQNALLHLNDPSRLENHPLAQSESIARLMPSTASGHALRHPRGRRRHALPHRKSVLQRRRCSHRNMLPMTHVSESLGPIGEMSQRHSGSTPRRSVPSPRC